MKNKKYFQIALYVFLTFAACFLFITAVEGGDKIAEVLQFWGRLLAPFAVGFGISYLVNFIMRFCEGLLLRVKWIQSPKLRRGLAMVSAYLVLLIVVALIVMLVVPQLVSSISSVVERYNAKTMGAYFASISNFFHRLVGNNPFLSDLVDQRLLPLLDKLVGEIFNWVPRMIPGLLEVISGITQGVSDTLMGFVLSIYLLADKERLCARVKKLTIAVFQKERGDRIIGFTRDVNDTVRDFLSGKLLECGIMSVLGLILFGVTGVEMPFLLAVILGISNIVPFIGPIVGTVVGGVLLLLVQPGDFWLYLILSLVLLQIDGNVIGPKILGKSTGLDALWIVVAILLGGGLFGLWGMILGVPVFAILYSMLQRAVNHRLAKASLPVATKEYVDYKGTEPEEPEQAPPVEKKPSIFTKLWKKKKK